MGAVLGPPAHGEGEGGGQGPAHAAASSSSSIFRLLLTLAKGPAIPCAFSSSWRLRAYSSVTAVLAGIEPPLSRMQASVSTSKARKVFSSIIVAIKLPGGQLP